MAKTRNKGQHGVPPRGLLAMADPSLSVDHMTGRFGRMFPHVPPTLFPEGALADLAAAMVTDDPPKDGADGEESDFGAAYTYLGQFIDHDLTFDPSTFAQQKSDPAGIVDFRTPAFDLDNVYGRGPSDQPYLYDGNKFALGQPLTNASRNPNARDLLRAPVTSGGVQRAIIGDPRNDENVIVSQFQGMMYRFHNAMVAQKPGATFDEVQQAVRWHYQWIVLRDFLPKIVDEKILNEISPAIIDASKTFQSHPPRLAFYRFSKPVMPVEFSVAAYRLGHSMVRPGYRVNEAVPVLPIFDPVNPNNGLNAFNVFNPAWGIDWQRFINLGKGPTPETDSDRVQLTYKIDTAMVNPLSKLPPSVAGEEAVADPRKMNLAFRNLLRGQILLLPSGQDVAQRMGLKKKKILTAEHIFIGTADSGDGTGVPPENRPGIKNLKSDFGGAFDTDCPLWVYILAESRHRFYEKGAARLTGVGGRIVAETFLGLMKLDRNSLVHAPPSWKPITGNTFTLADLLNAVLAA